MDQHNNKPQDTGTQQAPEDTKEQTMPLHSSYNSNDNTSDTEDARAAIKTYEQTADANDDYSPYRTPEANSSNDAGVQVAPTSISTPFHAVKAIILKPNPVFARLKNTANWSWLPFIIVTFCAVLPHWLYFSSVDLNWYSDLVVQAAFGDVSPAEQATQKQYLMQENMAGYMSVAVVFQLLLVFAIFALYLNKMTQIDEDNLLSYGDWYGFLWWVSIPTAIVGLLTAVIIMANSGPEIRPELIAPFSLSYLFGINLESRWFAWFQSISLDSVWSIYLMTVGISQWTRLTSRQCLIIAAAPNVIIWTVWAVFIIF